MTLTVPFPAATEMDVGTPPVTLRSSCIGLAIVKGGQELAGFAVVLVALPFAMAAEMEGLEVRTKFPQMPGSSQYCASRTVGHQLTCKGLLEFLRLGDGWRTKVADDIGAVSGRRNRVLVLEGGAPLARECFSHPVGWTDERGLGVKVLFRVSLDAFLGDGLLPTSARCCCPVPMEL